MNNKWELQAMRYKEQLLLVQRACARHCRQKRRLREQIERERQRARDRREIHRLHVEGLAAAFDAGRLERRSITMLDLSDD